MLVSRRFFCVYEENEGEGRKAEEMRGEEAVLIDGIEICRQFLFKENEEGERRRVGWEGKKEGSVSIDGMQVSRRFLCREKTKTRRLMREGGSCSYRRLRWRRTVFVKKKERKKGIGRVRGEKKGAVLFFMAWR